MANLPVDKNSKMMQEDFGTVVLITDPAADRYLAKAAKQRQCLMALIYRYITRYHKNMYLKIEQ